MASHIAAECTHCHTLNHQPGDRYTLYHVETQTADWYTFTCQRCHQPNAKPAPLEVAALLAAGRCRTVRLRVPAEFGDPQRTTQHRINWDDVLDFVNELSTWDGGDEHAGADRAGEGVA